MATGDDDDDDYEDGKVILSYSSTHDEWRRPDETAQKAQTT